MKKKIQNAISYYRRYRHFGDSNAVMKEAANYFADSYEEYILILDHLKRGYQPDAVAVPCNAPVLIVPPGCHYWGGQIRNNAQWRKQW